MMKKFDKNGHNFSEIGNGQIRNNILPKGVRSNKTDENLSTITDIINLLIKSIYDLETIKSVENSEFIISPTYDFPIDEVDFYETIRFYKINLIKNALRKSRGRQNKAAELLNLKKSTLSAIIKKYEIYL